MNPDYTPVVIIVAFVVYPFAVTGLAVFIMWCSGRERFPGPAAKVFALAGCVPPIWFAAKYGFDWPLLPLTVVGSAVFVFGAAATGFFFGAVLDLFVRISVDPHKRSEEDIANGHTPGRT